MIAMLIILRASVLAQVAVIPEVRTSGIILKQQLWSVLVNNMSGNSLTATLFVSITDNITAQSLVESTSNIFTLNQGIKRLSYNDLAPLNYTTNTVGFVIDQQLNQPIPVGEYLVCYKLVDAAKQQVLATECVKIFAEPLSPPQLILPENNSTLKDKRPALSWIPPAPVQMFNDLSYTVIVSPLLDKQSPEEALQRNIPVMTMNSINNSISYPSSFTDLEEGKTYVWQVAAYDLERFAGKSQVWAFTVMPDSVSNIISSAPFVKLSRQNSEPTILHQGVLKMEYFNSLPDSIVNVEVYKISQTSRKAARPMSFQLKVKAGQNFLEYEFIGRVHLDESAVYQATLVNGRKEKWQMKFNPKYYF